MSMPGLSEVDVERYSRQLVLAEWSEARQRRLREAGVLVVGLGALGSPVALYLAGAGVGRLGLLDGGAVELSNLHRQTLHGTPDVGRSKVASAAEAIGRLNPEVLVEPYPVRLEPANARALVAGHDLVVDCSDSATTRYAVNAACCMEGVALVEGGALGLEGLVLSIRPGQSACYRCVFPRELDPAAQRACTQAGVLGPLTGIVGSLQALEALKLLTGLGEALLDRMLVVEGAAGRVLEVATTRRTGCPDCG